MKLNLDCIRDVLLAVEELPLGQFTCVQMLAKTLNYSEMDILYSCVKLEEAHFIKTQKTWWDNRNMPHIDGIYDITFEGHEFLANIKPQSNWEKISHAFKQGGGASLKAVANVALDLGTDILRSKLKLG